ncbi:response regulator transcription factor [Antarcticibacterium flavum]|uniref:Response regulator transcription factor n=1 Tax=Antarcticibacterium flavum TaxID=2058175 RepID=A0A5B7X6L3_9FLAO|nr:MULTISPECIES: LuxR C-terminal-related transcriptional regulator [Antarcticibacterium]MCM4160893.1 hypothetical protein [Antarcticibacterium sp. W02-3]QCY71116.1 response regulator transcription factor [Antarcticibacterium flavum]
MKRFPFLFVLLICIAQGYAQNTLKGNVRAEENSENKEIVLYRLLPEDNYKTGEVVATGRIGEDGSFVLHDSVFSEKDEVYELHVGITAPGTKLLDTTINNFRRFILSNKDSVRFGIENSRGFEYSNSNEADREWQKLKEYEEKIAAKEDLNPENYLTETRNYTKDSLEILLVKLLSIQTLDEKQLLEKDITENPDFYLDLLAKLHDSDLDPASYTYLENKIRATHQELINRKYHISLAFNFFSFTGIVGLLLVVFRMHKRSATLPSVQLSPQEEKVKNLILEGKTNKEIAAALFISISTVKTHTSSIYSKLNVTNRRDLVLKHQNHTGTST